jgi:hypothetical protein
MRIIENSTEKNVLFRVDKYEILEAVGYGQFGIVYKGNFSYLIFSWTFEQNDSIWSYKSFQTH